MRKKKISDKYYRLAQNRFKYQKSKDRQKVKDKHISDLIKLETEMIKSNNLVEVKRLDISYKEAENKRKRVNGVLNTFIGIGAFMIILLILLLFGWAISKQ